MSETDSAENRRALVMHRYTINYTQESDPWMVYIEADSKLDQECIQRKILSKSPFVEVEQLRRPKEIKRPENR